MCGIVGVISCADGDFAAAVAAMQDALAHRGPDGAGEFHEPSVTLAMRRLSIIDLSGGWQPLYSEDRGVVLIANGEIYNFVELRSDLEGRGHRFQTKSDCETIVHLYEDHGTECVQHLRGMFAFALWDRKRRRLLLARDRMGEKPLYVHTSGTRLVFSSEMKSLLQSGLVPFELDPVSVHLYFHYQFVPDPLTPLSGIRKLPAGHRLVVDVDPWNIREECYWRMEDAPPIDADPAEAIRAQLDEVARLVIRSDVPVGIALSGGLDSGAIAVLAAKHYPGSMRAFSVGYPGRPPSDERAHAEALARRLGMEFFDVELETSRMVDFFPSLVYARDDPIADISGFGYYEVMRIAREHGVPVMLQGQGGDELFWGYDWVRQAAMASARKATVDRRDGSALPGLSYRANRQSDDVIGVGGWLKSVFRFRGNRSGNLASTASPDDQLIFYDLTPDWALAVEGLNAIYQEEYCRALNYREDSDPAHLFRFPRPWPPVGPLVTRLICDTYLRENGIAQGDRLSMASSVELRLPLVDHRLIETVIGLRKTTDDSTLPEKTWFKQALQGLVPPEVINRPKRGFTPPVREWHDALFRKYGQALEAGFLVEAGVLRREVARKLSHGPFPGNAVTPMSFKALVLEMWCRSMRERTQLTRR